MGQQWYQKHRPVSLGGIIGQEKTVLNLKKRFKERNFPQSFIFIGETGLGKTTLQRIVAMAIVCQNPDEEGNPCCACDNCIDVMDEDFLLSVSEKNCSNLGVAEIREFEDKVNELDYTGAPQVIILDEYQEMESKAQKNLLKLMENVNSNAHFIIGTMNKNKVPEAAKNRSQTFHLKPVDPDTITAWLADILVKEAVDYPENFIDPDTGGLFVIAECSKGSPRTALSHLEQAVYSELWTGKEVMEELDIVSNESLNVICAGILQNIPENVFSMKWTNELLYQVRARFVDVFKYHSGVEIKSQYFKKQVVGLASVCSKEQVEKILNVFFDMNKVFTNYWNEKFIEFSVLRAMREASVLAKPKKRERKPLKG